MCQKGKVFFFLPPLGDLWIYCKDEQGLINFSFLSAAGCNLGQVHSSTPVFLPVMYRQNLILSSKWNHFINTMLKNVPITKMRHICITPSLDTASSKMKWENQVNECNSPKQDVHYKKKAADFILFPMILHYGNEIKKKPFCFSWSLRKRNSSHRLFREYFLYSEFLSFVDLWLNLTSRVQCINVFSNSTLHQKDKA